jgi:hypothetical protein
MAGCAISGTARVLHRHAAQRLDARDVHQQLRVGQPEGQRGQQRLAAGQDLRGLAMLGARAPDIVEALRPQIAERRPLHRIVPRWSC